MPSRAQQESRLQLPVDCTVHLFSALLPVGVMAKPHEIFRRSTAAPKQAVAHGRISPATRNRTRDHLITACVYSQMLYQLSYSRLAFQRINLMYTQHLEHNKHLETNKIPCFHFTKWVHSSVVRAADCRSAGPWFKSGCALIIFELYMRALTQT